MGVIKIPIIPEILALQIAAGTLPLATATINTDEGKTARKKTANHKIYHFRSLKMGKKVRQLKKIR